MKTATLISKESLAHRNRWERVLRPYFDEFFSLDDNDLNFSSLRTTSAGETLISTDLSRISVHRKAFNNPERHIAISNSFDLMNKWDQIATAESLDLLASADQIWVDTNWGLEQLKSLGLENLRYIPWGLEDLERPLIPFPSDSPPKILIPRVSSSHYNPMTLLEVSTQLLAEDPGVRVTFMGLNKKWRSILWSLGSNQFKRFSFFDVQSEPKFLDLLDDHSHLLMAPKTDGSSITLLQALFQGRGVISTPTIGAIEWLSMSKSSTIARDFSTKSVLDALEDCINRTPSKSDLSKTRREISKRANLVKNVESALDILGMPAC